jgi:hypothetical protein
VAKIKIEVVIMANSNDSNKNYKLSQFRRNYFFYGKLMAVRDFELEQGYMNEKRHLLTRLISGTGIVCGLDDAEVYTDEEKVKIRFKTGGFALDPRGREIVIPAGSDREVYIKEGQTRVNLTLADLETSLYYVYLEDKPVFAEPVNSGANPSSCEETCSPNRVVEDFELVAAGLDPGAAAIVCPDLSADTVSETAKEKIKEWFKAGSSLLGSPGDRSGVFLLALESVGGEVVVNEEETVPYLSFVFNGKLFAELLTCHLSDFANPHKTDAGQVGALASVDGVSNPGGDVDLVQANSITITPDDGANTITIGETHSARTDNPHGITAAQLGALSSVDGVDNPGGNVDLVAENSIVITPNNEANSVTIGETHSVQTGNPHQTAHEDIRDVLPVFGDGENDMRNKHVSNNDAEKWNNAAAEAGLNSLNGVDNPGGNVDLVGQNAIKIVPDNTAKNIVINETHSTTTSNPHNTTAAQVGALSIKGGAVEGDVTINGNVGIKTSEPLLVTSGNRVALLESIGDEAHLILRTNEGTANHVHFVNRPGGRAAIRVNADPAEKDSLSVLREGNVGIGTEYPTNKLTVVATGRSTNLGIEGNEVAAAFYSDPGSNDRPIVIVNRGNPGGENHGPMMKFYFSGKYAGEISTNANGSVSYLPFTGSHLAWSKDKLEQNVLVSMTGENKQAIEDLPQSEPIYGITGTNKKNDKAVLGTVFSIQEEQILVAAVGNHFIWVTDKGADIEVGDALISSDVAGHAQKDPEEDKYSFVIGRASQNVKWEEVKDYTEVKVKGKKQKVKHALISVLFGFYEKRNG